MLPLVCGPLSFLVGRELSLVSFYERLLRFPNLPHIQIDIVANVFIATKSATSRPCCPAHSYADSPNFTDTSFDTPGSCIVTP